MVRSTRNRKLELTVFRTRTVNLTTFRDVGRARRIGRVKRKHTTFATPTRSFLGQKILSRVRRQQQIIRGRARNTLVAYSSDLAPSVVDKSSPKRARREGRLSRPIVRRITLRPICRTVGYDPGKRECPLNPATKLRIVIKKTSTTQLETSRIKPYRRQTREF